MAGCRAAMAAGVLLVLGLLACGDDDGWRALDGGALDGGALDGGALDGDPRDGASLDGSVADAPSEDGPRLDAGPTPSGETYYVSRTGTNADGRSWATAWNELDQIDWGVVLPGDLILIDGGAVPCTYPVSLGGATNTPQPAGCGMEYQTTLAVGRSGTPTDPVWIRLADETGRNGTARIFGGRSNVVPYCGQPDYADPQGRAVGVDLNPGNAGLHWVVVDGQHWAGIMVYGHRVGVALSSSNCLEPGQLSSDLTIRNLAIFDNGSSSAGSGLPNGPGVRLSGNDLRFERLLVHDNGQDAFQSDSSSSNILMRRVWLFNSRPLPGGSGDAFNATCTHSDGIQIYAAGVHRGLTLEDSIVGPGFMQALQLGDYSGSNACIGTTVVHDVTIRNTLLVGNHGPNNKNNLQTKADAHVQPTNYLLDRVTSVRDVGLDFANNRVRGSGHHVRDSIFRGGVYLAFDDSSDFAGNTCHEVRDDSGVCGAVGDPMFVDADYAGVGDGFAAFDFTVGSPAVPAGRGSSITTPAAFFGGP